MIHFYHLWLGGDWKPIAEEHFNALRAAEFPGGVRVGLVGSPEARDEAQNWLDRRWNYGIADEADEGFEEVTLRSLHDLAKALQPSTPILYAHNKGSFHPINGAGVNENTPWRQNMTEYLVTNWKDRIAELDVYDITAWRWLNPGTYSIGENQQETITHGHATGNFWWARADYLRSLPLLPVKLTEENRIEAEFWVGQHSPGVLGVTDTWPQVTVANGHWDWVVGGMMQPTPHWVWD